MSLGRIFFISLLIMFSFYAPGLMAQVDDIDESTTAAAKELKKVTMKDGYVYLGTILSDDGRELELETKKLGKIYLKKADVASIEIFMGNEEDFKYPKPSVDKSAKAAPVEQKTNTPSMSDLDNDVDIFGTRYVLTTNGLPMEKGEMYAMASIVGPEFHISLGSNFSIGIMTTWLGAPIVASAKKSFKVNDEFSIGTGVLVTIPGSLSLFGGNIFFLGTLPYVSATYGDYKNNITATAGYYFIDNFSSNNPINGFAWSIAGTVKLSKRSAFIFDSIIIPPSAGGTETFCLFMPGIRVNSNGQRVNGSWAFSIGFAVLGQGDGVFPIPMIQRFYRL